MADKTAKKKKETTTAGFQEGKRYPRMPVTPDDFAKLLDNPNLPAENQSAPSPEQLNPHLFPKK